MAAKRSSLFGGATPKVEEEAPAHDPSKVVPASPDQTPASRYPKAKTREGKRVAPVYLEREALRQLQKVAFDEEVTIQALLTEGINAVFERRGLSRIA